MVFNATFINISAISWRSVLFVEKTGVPGESQQPAAKHSQTVSHNVVSSTLRRGNEQSCTCMLGAVPVRSQENEQS